MSSAFSDRALQEALRIHELCDQYGLGIDKARLLVYIHSHGGDPGHFEKGGESCRQTLRLLLGDSDLAKRGEGEQSGFSRLYAEMIDDVRESLSALDALSASQKEGPRVSSELRDRLRLYEDRAFRTRGLSLYHEFIRPALEEAAA